MALLSHSRRRCWRRRVNTLLAQCRRNRGFRVALELAAGGVDVQSARLAHEAGKPAPDDCLEAGDTLRERCGVRDSGPGIERDQVDLGVEVGEQRSEEHTSELQ